MLRLSDVNSLWRIEQHQSDSDDDEGPTCTGGNRGSMIARINGAAWTASCIVTASYTGGIFSLGATDGVQTIGLGLSFVGFGDYCTPQKIRAAPFSH